MSEKGVKQGSILPAAQCAPNRFVNRFIDSHASMWSARLQTYLLHISLYEFFWSMLKQVSAHIIIHIDASPITNLQYEQFIFLPLGDQSLSHFLCAPKSLIW